MKQIRKKWKTAQYYGYGGYKVELPQIDVSNFGDIRWNKEHLKAHPNLRRNKQPKVAGNVDTGSRGRKNLYLDLKLYHQGKCRSFKVSRLVLSTFSPREDACALTADHLNDDINDNHISNLTWLPMADNIRKRTQKNVTSKS